jgi:CheY-like chemotaxis protein
MLETVGDGAAALKAVQEGEYDLVLMDVHMPVMDGLQCTLALRGRGVGIPIIAMTASAMEEDRLMCRDAGMDDFVGKPIEMPELWAVLVKWLGRRASTGGVPARECITENRQ